MEYGLSRSGTGRAAQGYPVLDEDIARMSAYMRKHINVHGHYSFRLPDLGGTGHPLRDPTTPIPTRTIPGTVIGPGAPEAGRAAR